MFTGGLSDSRRDESYFVRMKDEKSEPAEDFFLFPLAFRPG